MLSQKFRLSQKNDFQRIFSQGGLFRKNFFILRYLPQKLDHFRAAVVVSSKVSKKAVQRNKIRRRIYEILKELPLKNFDLIIVTRRPILKISFSELQKELKNALLKSHLLTNEHTRTYSKNQKSEVKKA
jgi:ribonuclease P protein component